MVVACREAAGMVGVVGRGTNPNSSSRWGRRVAGAVCMVVGVSKEGAPQEGVVACMVHHHQQQQVAAAGVTQGEEGAGMVAAVEGTACHLSSSSSMGRHQCSSSSRGHMVGRPCSSSHRSSSTTQRRSTLGLHEGRGWPVECDWTCGDCSLVGAC
jgi:hypothetical protein